MKKLEKGNDGGDDRKYDELDIRHCLKSINDLIETVNELIPKEENKTTCDCVGFDCARCRYVGHKVTELIELLKRYGEIGI